MFGSTVPETASGLIFILLLVSVLVTAAREMLANALRLRARFLRQGVATLALPIGWLALTATDVLNAILPRRRGDARGRVIPGLDFSRSPRGDSLCTTLLINL
jgi:hypothetical protein